MAEAVGMPGGNNTLLIGFGAAIAMKTHTAKTQSRLIVLWGQIAFRMDGELSILSAGDVQNISPSVMHSLEASADSLCLLIQQ